MSERVVITVVAYKEDLIETMAAINSIDGVTHIVEVKPLATAIVYDKKSSKVESKMMEILNEGGIR